MSSGVKQGVFTRARARWLLRALERRSVAITLATLALCLGFATFVVLSAGMSFGRYALIEPLVLFLNGLVLALLLLALVIRVWPMLVEHRKGLVGARLPTAPFRTSSRSCRARPTGRPEVSRRRGGG